MKFYRYILYKLLRFRTFISIRKLDYPVEFTTRLHTSGMFFIFTWPFFGAIALWVLSQLAASGFKLSRNSAGLLFVAVVLLPAGLINWFNYRLLQSANWPAYAAEFAAYSQPKRRWGSILVFLMLIGALISSLIFLHYFGEASVQPLASPALAA